MNCIADFADAADNYILSNFEQVRAEKCGFDNRVYKVWVSEVDHAIAVERRDSRMIMYYGGFEYVDDEAITHLPNWIVFHAHWDERVSEHFDTYLESQEVSA